MISKIIFNEELRQWLEERAREVEESNLALLAEMPFFKMFLEPVFPWG